MIKSLNIENFQSHEATNLAFDPGVNVVIGQSDSGKTAVLRALDWVVNNRPGGDAFRTRGSKETRVQLWLADGVIQRFKSKKDNLYDLTTGKLPARTDTFKAFGQGVPEEIQKVINLFPINWARQLDAPFLLSASPGEVAKVLNFVVNLDAIDRGLTNVLAWLRENKADATKAEAWAKDLEEQLAAYDYLDGMEKEVARLEGMHEQLHELEATEHDLQALGNKIHVKRKELKWHTRTLGAEPEVNRLIDLNAQLENLEQDAENIERWLNLIEESKKEIEYLDGQVKVLEAKFKKNMPELCPFYDKPCPLKKEKR